MKNLPLLKFGIFLMSCSLSTHGQPGREEVAGLSAEQLKTSYLMCDRRATREFLGFADAVVCSHISEALKHKVFGGDFNKLIEWWQAHKLPEPCAVCPPEKTEVPLNK